MTTETAIQVAEAPNVTESANPINVTATEPAAMVAAQGKLIAWTVAKIAKTQAEAVELQDIYTNAVEKKWKSEPLKKHVNLAKNRVTYFEKILAALQAGYYIVPTFEIDVFAVRTDRQNPTSTTSEYQSGVKNISPAYWCRVGDGRYVDPQPYISEGKDEVQQRDGTKKLVSHYWASGIDETIEFPMAMARVEVMDATKNAMDQKVFDEFGICPSRKVRNKDPMIIGRIADPRNFSNTWMRKYTQFMVAWHLNTGVL